MKEQSLNDSTSVYNMVYEYFKPIVEMECSEKRFLSKYHCQCTWSLKSSDGDIQ